METQLTPFEGFSLCIAARRFEVACEGLKLFRFYRPETMSRNQREFGFSAHGTAIADRLDQVRVFGTNKRSKSFDLAIYSRRDLSESWDREKRIEVLTADVVDPEQRRIRDIQYELFDKTPPTATLFNQGPHWSLEIDIPPHVMHQLSVDIADRRLERLTIRIDWPFAFVDNATDEWGFFEGKCLRGHILDFTWSLMESGQT